MLNRPKTVFAFMDIVNLIYIFVYLYYLYTNKCCQKKREFIWYYIIFIKF